MTEWRLRLGSNPWKNLLAEEASVAASVGPVPSPNQARQIEVAPLPEGAFFCFSPLTEASSPATRSFLVFQAGRMFLVGPTRAAVTAVERAGLWPRLHHIVLLTWHPDHLAGLVQVPDETQGSLTVWTSGWIWEETLRHFSETPGADRTLAGLRALWCWGPEEASGALARDGHANGAAVLCDRRLDVSVGLGVSIHLRYVPNTLPSLSVSFRCSHLEVALDPLNSVTSADDLEGLRARLFDAIRPFPTLVPEFYLRYGRVEDLLPAPIEHRVPPPMHVSGGAPWISPRPRQPWDSPSPVVLDMLGRATENARFVPTASAHQSPVPRLVISRSVPRPGSFDGHEVLRRTVVAIFCGGPAGPALKDLLHPGRQLSIPVDAGHRTAVYSIVEWRLRQLAEWAERFDVDLPVLLLTSPDTEGVVAQHMASLERELRGVHPIIVRQALVPVVMETDAGLEPLRLPDDGWMLYPSGHGDFLSVLTRWYQHGPSQDRSLCFAFAHNNLGHLLDDATLRTLQSFESAPAMMGVELFPLVKDPADGDHRWRMMSFVDLGHDTPVHLFKPSVYPPDDSARRDAATRYYSSHTWYFKLAELPRLGDGSYILLPHEAGAPAEAPFGRACFQPRQDLEQVTHRMDVHALAIIGDEPPLPPGLHASPRFLVARTEDDRRHAGFQEAFTASLGHRPARAHSLRAAPIDQPFIELIGSEMNYIWGGTKLAALKGLAPRRIAESWQISTHPSGVSLAYQNIRKPIPLRELLGGKDFPFMAEYLDCHEPLSIQVHPNRSTAAYLHEQRGMFDLQDGDGKEESFYVLETSQEEFHLYLGFDRQSLAPLARIIRPILAAFAASEISRLAECYREIAHALRTALESLLSRPTRHSTGLPVKIGIELRPLICSRPVHEVTCVVFFGGMAQTIRTDVRPFIVSARYISPGTDVRVASRKFYLR